MIQDFRLEEALKRLEEISEEMNTPELDLNEAMKYYEEGLALIKKCQREIKKAELKLTTLNEDFDSDINSDSTFKTEEG